MAAAVLPIVCAPSPRLEAPAGRVDGDESAATVVTVAVVAVAAVAATTAAAAAMRDSAAAPAPWMR